MRRYLIGQYGGYDEAKTQRDFRKSFFGMEACLFREERDVSRLVEAARAEHFRIGVHFPLRAGRTAVRDALFMAQDCGMRAAALEWIRDELEFLRPVKPEYVLFHYPKPVVLNEGADWSHWRFADPAEYVRESVYSLEEFKEKSEALFRWLTDRAEEYRFMPVLELDAVPAYIYETELLERLLERFPRIRLCLDVGRLYLQDRVDPGFSARDLIKKLAAYTEVVHLANTRFTDKLECRHMPVLPEQLPEEGWAPIEEYLTLIRMRNAQVKIHFEHRSDLIRDDDLERCYRWVDGLMEGPMEGPMAGAEGEEA